MLVLGKNLQKTCEFIMLLKHLSRDKRIFLTVFLIVIDIIKDFGIRFDLKII